jgi:hypothetical protein
MEYGKSAPICKFFVTSHCKKGDKCPFLHEYPSPSGIPDHSRDSPRPSIALHQNSTVESNASPLPHPADTNAWPSLIHSNPTSPIQVNNIAGGNINNIITKKTTKIVQVQQSNTTQIKNIPDKNIASNTIANHVEQSTTTTTTTIVSNISDNIKIAMQENQQEKNSIAKETIKTPLDAKDTIKKKSTRNLDDKKKQDAKPTKKLEEKPQTKNNSTHTIIIKKATVEEEKEEEKKIKKEEPGKQWQKINKKEDNLPTPTVQKAKEKNKKQESESTMPAIHKEASDSKGTSSIQKHKNESQKSKKNQEVEKIKEDKKQPLESKVESKDSKKIQNTDVSSNHSSTITMEKSDDASAQRRESKIDIDSKDQMPELVSDDETENRIHCRSNGSPHSELSSDGESCPPELVTDDEDEEDGEELDDNNNRSNGISSMSSSKREDSWLGFMKFTWFPSSRSNSIGNQEGIYISYLHYYDLILTPL